MSGLHHVGVRPRSLRYYTTERHSVMPAQFRFSPKRTCAAHWHVRFVPKADIALPIRFLPIRLKARCRSPRAD